MKTSTLPAEPKLVNAVINSHLTVADVWRRYFRLGGRRTRQELQAYLGLETRWSIRDHAILERAIVGYA